MKISFQALHNYAGSIQKDQGHIRIFVSRTDKDVKKLAAQQTSPLPAQTKNCNTEEIADTQVRQKYW